MVYAGARDGEGRYGNRLDVGLAQEEGGMLDILKVEQDIEFLGGSCDASRSSRGIESPRN